MTQRHKHANRQNGNDSSLSGRDSPSDLSRRELLKKAGAGVAGAALACYGFSKLGVLPGGGGGGRSAPAHGPMTYRTNPKTGDVMSLLGYGCMRLPLLSTATSAHGPEVDETAAFRLIDHAIEHGVNVFDSAYGYHGGQSEAVLGKALKRHKRPSFFLNTKMPSLKKPTLEEAKLYFRTQLERCQTDYFDYYLLHSITSVSAVKEIYEDGGVLEYILGEKAAGRIRHLGFSFHGDKECLEYLLSRDIDWDIALVQLNYHDLLRTYRPQDFFAAISSSVPAEPRWILERMGKTNIPLMVMEPLLGGRLAKLTRKAVAILHEEHPDASAASWAFRYVASIPNVMTVLSGMTYMEHLQDNLQTFGPLKPLTAGEDAALRRALDIIANPGHIPCTGCGYCTPCPYGVDIPTVFAHYNNCLDNQTVPKGARDAEYERARRAYLVGYDRTVPELKQAQRCTGCRVCVPQCPQFIAIPEEISRLGQFAERLRSEI